MLSRQEIATVRAAGALTARVLDAVAAATAPGITTTELDMLAHEIIVEAGAYPSPLGYRGFPKSICTSVNNVICHGIPDSRPLADGDVVKVDVTVFLNGFHGDSCRSLLVGSVDEDGKALVLAARECMLAGLRVCGPGVPFQAIGAAVEAAAQTHGLSVCKPFCGHGIGRHFHAPPDVFHFITDLQQGIMAPGMCFTVEPCVIAGPDSGMRVWDDGWTAVTTDGSRAAQWEHTVAVTDEVKAWVFIQSQKIMNACCVFLRGNRGVGVEESICLATRQHFTLCPHLPMYVYFPIVVAYS